MKKQILFLLICCSEVLYAQHRGGDASLLNVPVLTGGTRPELLTMPNVRQLCFDKKMQLLTQTRRGQLSVCLYINTRQGFIGYFTKKNSSEGDCSINPDTDDFNFNVISLRGNTFSYSTVEQRGGLTKTVATGNSDIFPASGGIRSSAGTGGTMRKLAERGSFAGGSIETYAYQAPGSPAKFHLYGNSYPAQITASSSTKALGVFGVGYTVFQNRVYLIMEISDGGNFTTSVTSVENVNTCFSTTEFKIFEDEFYQQGMEQIQREEQKIMRRRPSSGSCSGEELKLKNFQLEALARQKAALEKSRQGNFMENKQTQEALAKVSNYEDMIQQMIYEQELKICKLESDQTIDSRRRDQESYERLRRCYNTQLSQMHRVKADMAAVNTRYPNEPGRQNAEKAKLIMSIESCDR